jgi:hypothetical protein
MRRFILPVMALSLAVAPTAVDAQAHGMRGQGHAGAFGARAGEAGAAMNPAAFVLQHREALNLSLDQVRQLQQIQARIEQQNQPLREQLQAAAPGMGRGMAQRMEQVTPEQREQMRAQMQQRREQVTPEQREQMRAQMQQRRTEMQGMREQMRNATPEQREALRQQMQQQMRQHMEQLTPEQQAQMQARREQMQGRQGQGPAARAGNPAMRQQMEAVQPVMQQLREQNRQAQQEVQAVLTAAQREQLRSLRQEQAQEVRQGAAGMRERAGQRPAAGQFRRGPGR